MILDNSILLETELFNAILIEEDMFPRTFAQSVEQEYGTFFYNENNKTSYDSNHALIYRDKITDLGAVLDQITAFYTQKGITPSIYQATGDEGFFLSDQGIFAAHGYSVWTEGPNHFMLLTAENTIRSKGQLDIRLLTEWDERIAADICIPSDESHEIEVMKACIGQEQYRVFVSYEDERATAITYFHLAEGCCRFDYILVAAACRGRGYARELLSFVTDYCRAQKIRNCYQWPAHETSERICYEAGFRRLFSVEAGRAAYQSNTKGA